MRFTMLMLEIQSAMPGLSGHCFEGVAPIAAVIKHADHDFEMLHIPGQPTQSSLPKRSPPRRWTPSASHA